MRWLHMLAACTLAAVLGTPRADSADDATDADASAAGQSSASASAVSRPATGQRQRDSNIHVGHADSESSPAERRGRQQRASLQQEHGGRMATDEEAAPRRSPTASGGSSLMRRDLSSADCTYGDWEAWSPCSVTCGDGIRQTFRTAFRYAAVVCEEATKLTQHCRPECPKAEQSCEWQEWSDWDECSKSCGSGKRYRWREIKTYPEGDGAGCDGGPFNWDNCNEQECEKFPKIPCKWSPWEGWTPCSATCGGGGVRHSFRSIAVYPQRGGSDCPGVSWRWQSCVNKDCPSHPIDCAYKVWSKWSACSHTCGGGVREAFREILQLPQMGGKDCAGPTWKTEDCSEWPCPDPRIDCEWGDWLDWSECSRTCGGGIQSRERHVSVLPQMGGLQCEGDREILKRCNMQLCGVAVDCKWGDWRVFGDCSATCGTGQQQVFREFIRQPANGGMPCEGSTLRLEDCKLEDCADLRVNCTWGAWGLWGDCSRTCGKGKQMSFRDVVQYPRFGGEDCHGFFMREQECIIQECELSVAKDTKAVAQEEADVGEPLDKVDQAVVEDEHVTGAQIAAQANQTAKVVTKAAIDPLTAHEIIAGDVKHHQGEPALEHASKDVGNKVLDKMRRLQQLNSDGDDMKDAVEKAIQPQAMDNASANKSDNNLEDGEAGDVIRGQRHGNAMYFGTRGAVLLVIVVLVCLFAQRRRLAKEGGEEQWEEGGEKQWQEDEWEPLEPQSGARSSADGEWPQEL